MDIIGYKGMLMPDGHCACLQKHCTITYSAPSFNNPTGKYSASRSKKAHWSAPHVSGSPKQVREAQNAVRTVEEGLRRSMGKRDTKEAAWEAMLADLDPDQGPDSTSNLRRAEESRRRQPDPAATAG